MWILKNTHHTQRKMCSYFTRDFFLTISPWVSSVKFLLCVSYLFMVGWAFLALSGLFKFLTSRGKRQREWDQSGVPHLKRKVFPMKCCAVTWNTLRLLCFPMPLAPFNQIVKIMHASAFTVRVLLTRITMPRCFLLNVLYKFL